MIGTSLNQYRITASVGVGGMGEVFRARDTRLNRDVAVKVLPKDFVADADRLRRFGLIHAHSISIHAACNLEIRFLFCTVCENVWLKPDCADFGNSSPPS